MIEAGLVVEGGGMRGIYTCGVLDFFLEKKIVFENVLKLFIFFKEKNVEYIPF